MNSFRTGIFVCLLTVFFCATARSQDTGLRGDPQAVSLAESLLSQIGGKGLWAGTRTLYVRETSHTPAFSNIRYEAWRDLEVPRRKSIAKSESIDRQIILNGEDRWGIREGEFYQASAEATASDLAFWPGDLYIVYHRLAKADPRLTVVQVSERKLELHEDGKLLCWFEVSATGEPIRWGRKTEFENVEYVYGPMRSFGAFRMPAWGASLDGNWRFNYEDISGSAEPLELPAKPSQSPRQ